METPEEIKKIELSTKTILKEDKVRYVGVINRLGRRIVEEYREGVTSLLNDQESKMINMQLALEVFLREELNEKLGPIDYVLSKRKKVNLISIPLGKYLVLVSTDPGGDVESVTSKTTETLRNLLS